MDRVERTGLGLSVAGHVALAVLLSLGLFAASKPIIPKTQPIDIQIVDKVGLTDTVPNPSPTPPAARVTPEIGPPEEAAPEPQPVPEPVRTPEPAPREAVAPPKPVVKPAPVKPAPPKPVSKPVATKPTPVKPAPVKPAPARPSPAKPSVSKAPPADAKPNRRPGLSRSLIAGLTDSPGVSSAQPSKSTTATPRAAAGPAVEASLAREVLRQLKPFWHSPTGADAELLRTQLSISLARDGSVVAVRALGTTGVTDSNRLQVKLHQEAAIKAVKLAAPFSLPAEFFESWKLLEPVSFDRKLSQ
ncbi:MAG: cell envelope biosis protein TolA [Sphingomonadales bacterium]|nr:cell envelope biosis protein TolA [Sphingomonadales bacterium]